MSSTLYFTVMSKFSSFIITHVPVLELEAQFNVFQGKLKLSYLSTTLCLLSLRPCGDFFGSIPFIFLMCYLLPTSCSSLTTLVYIALPVAQPKFGPITYSHWLT